MTESLIDRCPFCGKWGQEEFYDQAGWYVACHPCGARGPRAEGPEQARQLWNARLDPQRYALGLGVEEAGEFLQLIGKALRFGLDAPGPEGAPYHSMSARQLLPVEAGDLSAAMHFGEIAGVWDSEDAAARLQIKLRKLLNPESRDAQGNRLAPDLGRRGAEMFERMSKGPTE